MELLERYLAAVRRDLPAKKADDIIAELRDDLLTRIEIREEALGRPLDKAELKAVLAEAGRPIVVAARYREQQYLIGPAAFPFYVAGLRFAALIVVILSAVLAGVDLSFGSRDFAQAAMQGVGHLFHFGIYAFAIVTFVVALIEMCGTRDEYTDWIDDLPAIDDLAKDSRADAPMEIIFGTLFLLWWFGVVPFPLASWEQFSMAPAPVWATLFWPIAAVSAARLVMSVLTLMPNRLAPLRHAIDIATAIGGLVIVALLYQAGHWVEVTPGTMAPAQAAEMEEHLNLAFRIALVVAAIAWTGTAIGGAWKWLRGRKG